jgi:hypothetical protein
MCKAVKPAGQGNCDEVERLYGVSHCTNKLSVILLDNNVIRFVRVFAPYGITRDNRTSASSTLSGRYGSAEVP